jgi:hypothetical protein
VVELLPSKCKALNSNPSIKKKKKKEKDPRNHYKQLYVSKLENLEWINS